MRATLAVAVAAIRTAVAMDDVKQAPAEEPMLGGKTSQGCFSAKSGEATELNMSRMSTGACFYECKNADEDFTVAVLGPNRCYCSLEYPPKDTLVDDDLCSFSCAAYPLEACGGLGTKDEGGTKTSYFSVWNLGVELNVSFAESGPDGKDESSDEGSKSGKGGAPKQEDGDGDTDGHEDNDEHHSPTPSTQTSEAATETISTPSITPSGDDSKGDNEDPDKIAEETTSTTETTTSEPSGSAYSAAASQSLKINVSGSIALLTTVIIASAL